VRIEAIELVRVHVPLVRPFRTSYGTEAGRDVTLVHVVTDVADGWGEDVAMAEPLYHYEYAALSNLALRDHLVPRLLAEPELGDPLDAARRSTEVVRGVQGYPMAKCAIEAAVLDAACRALDRSLTSFLGGTRTRVVAGVAVGVHPTLGETLAEINGYLADGYRRLKLKIAPGHDIDLMRVVRAHVGDDVMLQVDANGAYTLADADHLARLDAFDLLLIEQPLAQDDLLGHAELARRLRTPVCLDETITSPLVAEQAIELGACDIVNVKPGRVGGFLAARAIHDLCLAREVPAWVGGMLETGVGRAANLALASLPGFDLPADLSASDRYYRPDLTTPFVLHDGAIEVPTGPGIGAAPRPEVLTALGAEWWTAAA
jgi:O-succinylbenzoate synthase